MPIVGEPPLNHSGNFIQCTLWSFTWRFVKAFVSKRVSFKVIKEKRTSKDSEGQNAYDIVPVVCAGSTFFASSHEDVITHDRDMMSDPSWHIFYLMLLKNLRSFAMPLSFVTCGSYLFDQIFLSHRVDQLREREGSLHKHTSFLVDLISRINFMAHRPKVVSISLRAYTSMYNDSISLTSTCIHHLSVHSWC